MDKNTKSILLLIVVSLIIAGAFNFILGALLDPDSYKPVSHESPSSSQGITQAEQDAQAAGNSTADVSSLQSGDALQQTPAQTPESAVVPASISAAVQAGDYQDVQWIANVQKHSALLSKDVNELGTTSSDLGANELASYGQLLIMDTQSAIEENKQYVVSPKLQSAQKEWELALNDYSSAGELLSQAADKTNNVSNSDDTKRALSLVDSGSGHFGKVQEYLKTT